jgi:hypothetical protein
MFENFKRLPGPLPEILIVVALILLMWAFWMERNVVPSSDEFYGHAIRNRDKYDGE